MITSPTNLKIQDIIPSSFDKGHAFEDYIICLFTKKHFKLLEWRGDKRPSNGMFVESNCFPDLEFAYKGKNPQKFAIECKWRERFVLGKIKWANEKQITNYLDYQNQNRIQVYVAIGIGGFPSDPEKLFVTPLDNISMFTEIYEADLIPYNRDPKKQFFYNAVQLKLY